MQSMLTPEEMQILIEAAVGTRTMARREDMPDDDAAIANINEHFDQIEESRRKAS